EHKPFKESLADLRAASSSMLSAADNDFLDYLTAVHDGLQQGAESITEHGQTLKLDEAFLKLDALRKEALEGRSEVRSTASSQSPFKFEQNIPQIRVFDQADTGVALEVSQGAFDAQGTSRIYFDRVRNQLFLNGQSIDFNLLREDKSLKQTVTQLVAQYEETHKDRDVLAVLPNGNLGFNAGYAGIADGKFYHYRADAENNKSYDMLVNRTDGTLAVMTLKNKNAAGEAGIFDADDRDVSKEINFAVAGQRLVKDGKNNLDEAALQTDDLRHLFRLPMFDAGYRDGADFTQLHLGVSDMFGELYRDPEKIRQAISGEAITLRTAPLNSFAIDASQRDAVFKRWGYANVTGQRTTGALLPGEYVMDETAHVMTIKLLPGIHPHTFIGLTKDGKILTGGVQGETHFKGMTLKALIETLIRADAKDVFLWANGKDTAVKYPDQENLSADNVRQEFLEVLLVTAPKARSEVRSKMVPGTVLLRDTAQVLVDSARWLIRGPRTTEGLLAIAERFVVKHSTLTAWTILLMVTNVLPTVWGLALGESVSSMQELGLGDFIATALSAKPVWLLLAAFWGLSFVLAPLSAAQITGRVTRIAMALFRGLFDFRFKSREESPLSRAPEIARTLGSNVGANARFMGSNLSIALTAIEDLIDGNEGNQNRSEVRSIAKRLQALSKTVFADWFGEASLYWTLNQRVRFSPLTLKQQLETWKRLNRLKREIQKAYPKHPLDYGFSKIYEQADTLETFQDYLAAAEQLWDIHHASPRPMLLEGLHKFRTLEILTIDVTRDAPDEEAALPVFNDGALKDKGETIAYSYKFRLSTMVLAFGLLNEALERVEQGNEAHERAEEVDALVWRPHHFKPSDFHVFSAQMEQLHQEGEWAPANHGKATYEDSLVSGRWDAFLRWAFILQNKVSKPNQIGFGVNVTPTGIVLLDELSDSSERDGGLFGEGSMFPGSRSEVRSNDVTGRDLWRAEIADSLAHIGPLDRARLGIGDKAIQQDLLPLLENIARRQLTLSASGQTPLLALGLGQGHVEFALRKKLPDAKKFPMVGIDPALFNAFVKNEIQRAVPGFVPLAAAIEDVQPLQIDALTGSVDVASRLAYGVFFFEYTDRARTLQKIKQLASEYVFILHYFGSSEAQYRRDLIHAYKALTRYFEASLSFLQGTINDEHYQAEVGRLEPELVRMPATAETFQLISSYVAQVPLNNRGELTTILRQSYKDVAQKYLETLRQFAPFVDDPEIYIPSVVLGLVDQSRLRQRFNSVFRSEDAVRSYIESNGFKVNSVRLQHVEVSERGRLQRYPISIMVHFENPAASVKSEVRSLPNLKDIEFVIHVPASEGWTMA
ncbi:MAG: hypothetical protein KBC91_06485, partial [Candidatus Omnitrophica bacterium]|nr:hypothetical protein [Candidatus Omnitrophota bacterium]